MVGHYPKQWLVIDPFLFEGSDPEIPDSCLLFGGDALEAYVQSLWTLAARRGLAVDAKGSKMRSAAATRSAIGRCISGAYNVLVWGTIHGGWGGREGRGEGAQLSPK